MTSGGNNELSSLFSSGKAQEAKQLIVAVASLINYSPAEVWQHSNCKKIYWIIEKVQISQLNSSKRNDNFIQAKEMTIKFKQKKWQLNSSKRNGN